MWCCHTVIPGNVLTGFANSKEVSVSTVLPSLVPPQRIDDCVEIHNLRWELCDPQVLNHQMFRSGHDCTSAFSARRPCILGFQADIAISVLRVVSKMLCLPDTAFARDFAGNSWEELEASRCSGTFPSTRPCLNSCSRSGRSCDKFHHSLFVILIWVFGFCWSTRRVSSYSITSSSSSLASPTSLSQDAVTPTQHPASTGSESVCESLSSDQEQRMARSSPCCILSVCHFWWVVVFWPLVQW